VSPRRASQADLGKAFGSVARVMKENRASLNSADEFNHNHGDNMVDTFQTIAQAMKEKKGSPPSEQLAFAGQKLGQTAQSGSAKLYSEGLAQAAERVKGQSAITPESAMMLVQALMGGQASASTGAAAQGQGGMGDLLGALLGGGQTAQPAAQGQPDMTDLLGSLLGGQTQQTQHTTQASAQQGSAGIDLNTLLAAGSAFFKARQEGAAPLESIVQAVMAGSQMHSSTHREQSGQMVAGTLLNALGSMLGGGK